MLVALDEELAKRNIAVDDYVEGPWNALQYQGKQYGIPLDVHPWVLFYNKTILGELGLLNEAGEFNVPNDPVAFREMIDAIQDAGHYSLSAEYAGGGGWRGWFALLKQAGGDLFEGQNVLVNSPTAKETLTWWSSIPLDYPNLVVDYDESVALFAQGDAALHFNGVWATGYYEQIEGLDFGVAPFPTLYGKDAGWGNSHSFVVPAQRGNITADKFDAIFEFVEWMTSNSYKWALAGHIPTRYSVLESQEFKALPYRPDYAAQSETVVYLPQHIHVLEIETAVSEEAMAAALGAKSVDEALRSMEQVIQSLIR
jgi:multiple sugar transport system substrate-binding protein